MGTVNSLSDIYKKISTKLYDACKNKNYGNIIVSMKLTGYDDNSESQKTLFSPETLKANEWDKHTFNFQLNRYIHNNLARFINSYVDGTNDDWVNFEPTKINLDITVEYGNENKTKEKCFSINYKSIDDFKTAFSDYICDGKEV